MQNSIYVTGLGAVTPAGIGANTLYSRILNNQTTIAPSAKWHYHVGELTQQDLAKMRAGTAENLQKFGAHFSGPITELLPAHVITVQAMSEAMEQAGWHNLDSETDGVIFATTTGQIPIWEHELIKFMLKQSSAESLVPAFRNQPLGLAFKQICQSWDFNGPMQTVVSACAASAQAVHLAELWLRQGKVKRCLVGGAELLCSLVLRGFDAFQLLAPETASPFGARRRGINLSEGAAFFCLETAPKSAPLAILKGSGISLDAYHMTAPEPSGQGIFNAMKAALAAANLSTEDIDWVYAHGTGSPHNDSAEGNAVARLFGDKAPYVSSTKAVHGHALAATGIMEMVMAVKSLAEQRVLSTVNLTEPDPQIKVKHPIEHPSTSLNHILKTTLGFGGSNAAVVLSKVGT